MTELVHISPQFIEVKLRCPSLDANAYDHADILLELNPRLTVDQLREFLISKEVLEGKFNWGFKTLSEPSKELANEETMSSLRTEQTYLMCYPCDNSFSGVQQHQHQADHPHMVPSEYAAVEMPPPTNNNLSDHLPHQVTRNSIGTAQRIQQEEPAPYVQQYKAPSTIYMAQDIPRPDVGMLEPTRNYEPFIESRSKEPSPQKNQQQQSITNSASVSPVKNTHRNEFDVVGAINQQSHINSNNDDTAIQPTRITGTTQAAGGEACCCSTM